jgi:hypothetical protein
MEPESPSPYPQVPATCPYPEPTPSSLHDPLQLPEDPSEKQTHCVIKIHTTEDLANTDMVSGRKMMTRTTRSKVGKGSGKGEGEEFEV